MSSLAHLRPRCLFGLATAIVLFAFACGSTDSAGIPDADGSGGPGGGTTSPSSTCGGPGQPACSPTEPGCGTANNPKCAAAMPCKSADACESGVCSGGTCAAPTSTDGIKNGDETDVDCGGKSTNAPGCETGKTCAAHSDCESGGCAYDKTCAEAPSCTPHLGGDTCGAGEVGSGNEKHESCCRSLEVPGFTDPVAPGKKVYLDKYEVTAGRVRAFVERMTEQYGQPNIKQWVKDNPPKEWQDAWSTYLASDTDAEQTAEGNVGTNYAFGSALYIYVHGHNCFQGAGSYGFPTYWYPDDVMKTQNGGLPRVATKDELDVKAMTCVPNAVLAAFCAWDGGLLASDDVLNKVTSNGANLPKSNLNISADSGSISGVYYFPQIPATATHEGVSRIAAPGRVEADATKMGGAAEPWMDLAGNLNEVARAGAGFALLYRGIGYSSARALQNPSAIPQPKYKAAYSGGRCMRFR